MRVIYINCIIFLLFFTQCKKEGDFDRINKAKWKPELAVPLINTSLSAQDILDRSGDNDYVELDSINMITLIYSSRLYSESDNNFFQIEDIPAVLTNNINYVEYISDNNIKNLNLKSGVFSYSLNTSINDDIRVDIKMPFALKDNIPFEESFTVYYTGLTQITENDSIDLSGYNFDLTCGGTKSNSFLIEYKVTNTSDGQDITSQHPLDIDLSKLQYIYVDGYFGRYAFNLKSDTIELDIFKNWKEGTVLFEDPQIHFLIRNSFGLPITAEFSTIDAWGNSIIPISSYLIEDKFSVDFPVNSEEDITETELIFDSENSNVADFIKIAPNFLSYSLLLISNIDDDSTSFNFLTDESELVVDVDIKLPMHGRINNMILQDTFDFNVSTEELLKKVETAEFLLQTENTFPLEASIQLYFANNKFEILDSLLIGKQKVIEAGQLGDNGIVTQSTSKATTIYYDYFRSDEINNATKIILYTKLNTTDSENSSIKIYSQYNISLKLGIVATTLLNEEDEN